MFKHIKTIEDLESELQKAVNTDKALPRVAKLGAKSNWPDIAIRLINDECEPKYRCFTTLGDISKWEVICLEWPKLFKNKEDWAIVWAASCGVPVYVIARKMNVSRTKIWYMYNRGIRQLFYKLTGIKAPNLRHKRRISGYCLDRRTIGEYLRGDFFQGG